MTAMFTLASSAWRFRNDDGSESTATWKAAQNTQPSAIASAVIFRLRFRAGDTGGASGTITPRIYYSKNGAAYAAVGTTTPVKFADSANIANNATTSQLTGGGGGTFVAGAAREDNSAAGVSLGANGNTESEWVLVFDAAQVVGGDTFTFQIADNTTLLTAVTATVAVSGPPPQTVSPGGIASGEAFGTASISGGISATDDTYLDEAGQVWLDETNQPILIPEISKGTFDYFDSDLQSETGLDISDENGYPILMPRGTSGLYEYWNGTVWTDTETFINLTGSPATITNWPGRAESFELGIRGKDSVDGIGDYSSIVVAPAKSLSTAGAIASAEAAGTPVVTPGNVNLSPGGIAGAEAFGTATLALTGAITISAAGAIASAEALGVPVLSSVIAVSPSGIASAQAFGAVTLGGTVALSPGGIASAQAFGTAVVTVGILTISPSGIVSLEALGTPALSRFITVSPGGIASLEGIGTPSVQSGIILVPTGIASAQAFGTPALSARITVTPVAIASGQAFGTAFLINYVTVVSSDSLLIAVDGPGAALQFIDGSDLITVHFTESSLLHKKYVSGPPPDEIALAAIAANTRITRRVDIYEADGITPFMLEAPFMEGNVTVDSSRDERRMFDLKLYNEDGALTINPDGFWYDKIIKIYRGIITPTAEWERKLGEFMIDQATSPHFPNEVSVSGRDMTKKLLTSKFQQATAFPINTPIENIIHAVAINAGIPEAKIDLPLTGKSTGKEFFYDRGAPRWDACKQLANSYGYDIYFTNEGVLTMTEFADPTLGQPDYEFHTGPGGQIEKYEKRTADARLYNHVVVTGERDNLPPVWAEAKNEVPGHPTSIARIGDRTYFFTSSFISTTIQAQDVADKFLKIHALEQFEASLNTIVLPWLDAGTIVDFIDPDPADGDPTRYLMSDLQIPLGLTSMPATLKRVTAVV